MKNAAISAAAILFVMCGTFGCNDSSQQQTTGRSNAATQASEQSPSQTPLHKMRYNVLNGRMDEAWKYADDVVKQNSDDPEAMATLAQVAHAVGHPERAAELLSKACEAENYADEQRVVQTMVAYIAVGKFFDGIPILESAITQQPNHHETRRLLFDFFIGTENRPKALEHGYALVKQREFDLPLLLNLGNTETRALTSAPLKEVSKRNPDDKRPLIGDAKIAFDKGDLQESVMLSKEILASHPKFLPAQALLCFALAASSEFDQLDSFTKSGIDDGIETFPVYWLALGDAARHRDRHGAAATAYWKATRCDVGYAEAWAKLASSLRKSDPKQTGVTEQQLAAIDKRATLLSRFNQQRSRFERSGKASREIGVKVAEALQDLGRLWEAEAWASILLTLPEDEEVPVTAVRAAIVKQLSSNTPWQLTTGSPELSLDLSRTGPGKVAAQSNTTPNNPNRSDPTSSEAKVPSPVASLDFRFQNEATQRGLTFFGRTDDELDKPGVMLHRTLGCGGGTIDFDLDGWSDLYLIAAGGTPPGKDSDPNALMRNLDGSFQDATMQTATGDRGFGQGVAVGDVNEDGFPDILVLNYGPNALFINNGDGTFRDCSEQWFGKGLDDVWSASAAIADIDGDTIADVVIVNYCDGLEPAIKTCPLASENRLASCTPMLFPGAADTFYKGRTDGGFDDCTAKWQAKPDVLGRGLGISVGDFDDQAGLDILIANDMTDNHFWTIQTDQDNQARALESSVLRGLGNDDRALAQGSMGIATADFDRDGDVDFYVTNFEDEYNSYYDNRGGTWQDITKRVDLSEPTLPLVGFGSEAVDLDNDGNLELVVSNGHVDMFSRDNKRSVYQQPLQVFSRLNDGSFASASESMKGEYVETPHVGRALWTIDADRDGRLDLAITHQTEPVALLMNRSPIKGSKITLVLHPTKSSRNAVGTKVKVTDRRSGQAWTSTITAGHGYLCSNDPSVVVGLGEGVSEVDLQITWPSGTVATYEVVPCQGVWSIVEGDWQPFAEDEP